MMRCLPLLLVLFMTGCGGDMRDKSSAKNAAALANETAAAITKSEDLASFREALDNFERKIQASPRAGGSEEINAAIADFHKRMTTDKKLPKVVMETSMGTVKIELYPSLAPESVQNFLAYVDDKFYDGTIFHRVIPTFMIQGGGFGPDMSREKDTRPPIKNEAGNLFPNTTGTLAMARTSQPHSATSQFFINVKDNDFLNRVSAQDKVGYTVFGKVYEGMDVVNKIRAVETGKKGPHDDVPTQPVFIKSIRRLEAQ